MAAQLEAEKTVSSHNYNFSDRRYVQLFYFAQKTATLEREVHDLRVWLYICPDDTCCTVLLVWFVGSSFRVYDCHRGTSKSKCCLGSTGRRTKGSDRGVVMLSLYVAGYPCKHTSTIVLHLT